MEISASWSFGPHTKSAGEVNVESNYAIASESDRALRVPCIPSWIFRALLSAACLIPAAGDLQAQGYSPSTEPRQDSRIFGVLPNDRTIPGTFQNETPMSGGQKFRLAYAESFDRSSFFVAGLYAGMAQAGNQDPSWGQGAKGFSKRYGAAYADQAIANYLTTAVFPILLHEDPRYFRMGHGTFIRRMSYAVDRIAVTRTDKGSSRANYSEFLGTAVAAGISNAYYPAANRTVGNTMTMFGYQLATGALFNVLQEFWPDMQRKLSHKSLKPRSGTQTLDEGGWVLAQHGRA